jgi:hypothetical protein
MSWAQTGHTALDHVLKAKSSALHARQSLSPLALRPPTWMNWTANSPEVSDFIGSQSWSRGPTLDQQPSLPDIPVISARSSFVTVFGCTLSKKMSDCCREKNSASPLLIWSPFDAHQKAEHNGIWTLQWLPACGLRSRLTSVSDSACWRQLRFLPGQIDERWPPCRDGSRHGGTNQLLLKELPRLVFASACYS